MAVDDCAKCKGPLFSDYVEGPHGLRCCVGCASELQMDMRRLVSMEPMKTTAPAELVEFLQRMKGMRMRQGKGEFVASDGTRMPYDFVFEREEKPGRKGDDE